MFNNLAITQRPKKLQDVIGQTVVTKEIGKRIVENTLSHTILLRGASGTGKSTTAFIIASALNCEHRDEAGNPCGECPSCKAIFNQEFTQDVILFDAGTSGVKDTALELIDSFRIAPMYSRNKVYIIEEADQLTESAKSAFYKALEKLRDDVYIIFLSMYPKFNMALSSRLQTYVFKPLKASDIMSILYTILKNNNLVQNYEKTFLVNMLGFIAENCGGSARQAIQLLEKIITNNIKTQEEYEAIINNTQDGELSFDAILLGLVSGEDTVLFKMIENDLDFNTFFAMSYGTMTRANMLKITGKSPSQNEWYTEKLQTLIAKPYFSHTLQAFQVTKQLSYLDKNYFINTYLSLKHKVR